MKIKYEKSAIKYLKSLQPSQRSLILAAVENSPIIQQKET